MAFETREVVINFVVNDQALLRSDEYVRSLARGLGVSEDRASDLNKTLTAQARALTSVSQRIASLERQEEQLNELRNKTNDPQRLIRFNREIVNIRQEIGRLNRANRSSESILEELEAKERRLLAARERSNDPALVARYDRQLQRLGLRLDEIRIANVRQGRESARAGRQSASGFNVFRGAVQGVAGFFIGGAIIGGIRSVISGLTDFGKQSILAAADFEKTSAAFEVFLGSGQAATELLNELNTLSVQTPLEPREVIDAGQALLAFGEAADDIPDRLRRIGDIATGTNNRIGDIAEIYGKARVQGRLFAEDINQLTGRGIPIIQELARQFGVTDSEVKKLVESGQVGFAELEQAFISLTDEGGKFFGIMERQSQTVSGQISTLTGNFDALQKAIGERLLPIAGEVVGFFNDLVLAAKEYVSVSVEDSIREEQQELNTLALALASTLPGQERRTELINELNETYPDFLENIDAEKASTEEILSRLEDVNNAYVQRIALARVSDVLKDSQEDLAATTDELATRTLKAEEALARVTQQYPELARAQREAQDAGLTGIELFQSVAQAIEDLGITQSEYTRASTTFGNNFSPSSQRVSTLAGSFVGLVSRLSETTEKFQEQSGVVNDQQKEILNYQETIQRLLGTTKELGDAQDGQADSAQKSILSLQQLRAEALSLQQQLRQAQESGDQAKFDDIAAQLKSIGDQIRDREAVLKIGLQGDAQAQQKIDDIKASIEQAELEFRVELAGGAETVEGLRIIEEAQLAALEQDRTFQRLREENASAANAKILSERLSFAERIAQASTNTTQVEQQEERELQIIRDTFQERLTSLQQQNLTEEQFSQERVRLSEQENEAIFQAVDIFQQRKEQLQQEEIERERQFAQEITQARQQELDERLERLAIIAASEEVTQLDRLNRILQLEQLSTEERSQLLDELVSNEQRQNVERLIESQNFEQAKVELEKALQADRVTLNENTLAQIANLENLSIDERKSLFDSLLSEEQRVNVQRLLDQGETSAAQEILEQASNDKRLDNYRAYINELLSITEAAQQANDQRIQQLQAIAPDNITAAEQAELDQRLAAREDFAERLKELDKEVADNAIAELKRQTEADEQAQADRQVRQQETAAVISEYVGFAQDALGAIVSLQEQQSRNEINEINRRYEASRQSIEARINDETTSTEQRAQLEEQLTAVQRNQDAELEKIQAAQSRRAKALALFQVVLAQGQAVANIWANPTTIPEPAGTIQKVVSVGVALAAIAGALKGITSASPGFFHGGYTDSAPAQDGQIVTATLGKKDHTGRKVRGVVHEKEYVANENLTQGKESNVVRYLDSVSRGQPQRSFLQAYIAENMPDVVTEMITNDQVEKEYTKRLGERANPEPEKLSFIKRLSQFFVPAIETEAKPLISPEAIQAQATKEADKIINQLPPAQREVFTRLSDPSQTLTVNAQRDFAEELGKYTKQSPIRSEALISRLSGQEINLSLKESERIEQKLEREQIREVVQQRMRENAQVFEKERETILKVLRSSNDVNQHTLERLSVSKHYDQAKPSKRKDFAKQIQETANIFPVSPKQKELAAMSKQVLPTASMQNIPLNIPKPLNPTVEFPRLNIERGAAVLQPEGKDISIIQADLSNLADEMKMMRKEIKGAVNQVPEKTAKSNDRLLGHRIDQLERTVYQIKNKINGSK